MTWNSEKITSTFFNIAVVASAGADPSALRGSVHRSHLEVGMAGRGALFTLLSDIEGRIVRSGSS
jgi:hypothetical protein